MAWGSAPRDCFVEISAANFEKALEAKSPQHEPGPPPLPKLRGTHIKRRKS